MGLESIEKRMREMGENILLDMVVWVHLGWTCLLNMEVGSFLGRSRWDFLFRKVLPHGPCGVATFNYHSIIYNKYICYLCVRQWLTLMIMLSHSERQALMSHSPPHLLNDFHPHHPMRIPWTTMLTMLCGPR